MKIGIANPPKVTSAKRKEKMVGASDYVVPDAPYRDVQS